MKYLQSQNINATALQLQLRLFTGELQKRASLIIYHRFHLVSFTWIHPLLRP